MSINPLQQQQQTTMNSAALSPYFCPYNWIFGPTSPLYHRYYPHPWCRRKIFVWYVEMLPKYTAECPTIKITQIIMQWRSQVSSSTIGPSESIHRYLPTERHHRLPPTAVSCRTFTIDCRQRPFHVERTSNYMQRSSVLTVMVARRWYINRFPRGRSYCMHRNATRSCCTSCYYVANWREQRPREGSVEGYMSYP